jgi:hypothetical protein
VSRATLAILGLGGVCALATLVLGLAGAAVLPSWLGAWLFVLALPLGALPICMAGELLGIAETRVTAALRVLVAVMPLAAVLAIPVLLGLGTLYPGLSQPRSGFAGWWMTPAPFVVRAVLMLGVWTALAAVFRRAPGQGARRGRLAGLGLGLHAVMATLAAADWVQGVEPGFTPSSAGLVLVAAQCSIALCLAVVMSIVGWDERQASHGLAVDRRDLDATRHVGTALASALGLWGFMVFTQYLVAWSANLPREAAWYGHRSAGLGLLAESCVAPLCAVALVALLARGLSRHAGVLAWAAAALLTLHGLEMLWLVTPAFRAQFDVPVPDVLALAGTGALGIGFARMRGERDAPEGSRHGTA